MDSVHAQAINTDMSIRRLQMQVNRSFLDLAEQLCIMHDGELWQLLDYESFWSYCADPDVDVGGRTTVYDLMAIHKTFREHFNANKEVLASIRKTKLLLIRPLINSDEDLEFWLNQAMTLSKSALIAQIADMREGREELEDVFDEDESDGRIWFRCIHCGQANHVQPDGQLAGEHHG